MDTPQVDPLKPAQRRALQQSLARCVACDSKLQYLRSIGVPQDELEARLTHLHGTIETALSMDREAQQRKG